MSQYIVEEAELPETYRIRVYDAWRIGHHLFQMFYNLSPNPQIWTKVVPKANVRKSLSQLCNLGVKSKWPDAHLPKSLFRVTI